jgi:tRNA threonylcarbamoyladenosine biosynthesis protein TsaB
MVKLIMDSATAFLYIAMFENEKPIWTYLEKGNNNHSEKLTVLLRRMFEETAKTLEDIDVIHVGKGPGSYTGVRVALMVAKMFSWVKNIPLYTFSSLDLLLTGHSNHEGTYIVRLDAKRGNSFAKIARIENNILTTLMEECFIENEELDKIASTEYPNAVSLPEATKDDFHGERLADMLMLSLVEDVFMLVPSYLRSGL